MPAVQGRLALLAVDWTDVETFARPRRWAPSADPEASWGHRRGRGPGKSELFFGYYLQLATMVADEGAAAVPELVRRMALSPAALSTRRAFVPVLERHGRLGRRPRRRALRLGLRPPGARALGPAVARLGAELVMDLHPHDRGTQGTFGGAICWNGNLYCPATPRLFDLEPLARGADRRANRRPRRAGRRARPLQARPDQRRRRRRLPPGHVPGGDGQGPLPAARALDGLPSTGPVRARPSPPRRAAPKRRSPSRPRSTPRRRQKHAYPPGPPALLCPAHRAERANATFKDPAATDVARGWCRVMGLCAICLFSPVPLVLRNERIVDAFEERQRDDQRRRETGLEPKTRKRRRRTSADLIAAATD